MFTRLTEFRSVLSRLIAPEPRQAFTHCNDNLSLRRPVAAAVGERRCWRPALVCRWLDRNGRLESRWQVETGDDALSAEVDDYEPPSAGRGFMAGRDCNQSLPAVA